MFARVLLRVCACVLARAPSEVEAWTLEEEEEGEKELEKGEASLFFLWLQQCEQVRWSLDIETSFLLVTKHPPSIPPHVLRVPLVEFKSGFSVLECEL